VSKRFLEAQKADKNM